MWVIFHLVLPGEDSVTSLAVGISGVCGSSPLFLFSSPFPLLSATSQTLQAGCTLASTFLRQSRQENKWEGAKEGRWEERARSMVWEREGKCSLLVST